MTAVSVSFDGSRITGAETESDGGVWDIYQSTQSPTQETDFVYQGNYAVSRKVSGTTGGLEFDDDSTVDYATTPKVVVAKVNITTYKLIDTTVANGCVYEIGNDQNNKYEYYIWGSGEDYPIYGGWQIIVIDPNVSGYRDNTVGTPALGTIDYYALYVDITGSVKSENIVHDALDYVDSGKGLTLVSGDGGDTDGVFQDFIDKDEGTSNNRWGIVTSKEGILYVNGVLTIGNATATEFTDSLKTIVFSDARVNAGFFGIDLGLQNVSTIISMSNCTFLSVGNETISDTRAILEATGTSGSATIDACTFINFANIILTSGVTFSDNVIVTTKAITQNQATISSCTFDSPSVASGTAFMTVADISDISDCTFLSSGTGHAIELTSAHSASPTEYVLDGCTFTGYGLDDSNDASIYNNSGKALIINITNGIKPTVRNGSGASTTVNISVNVQFKAVDKNDNPIENVQISAYLISDDSQVILTDTNASGIASTTFSGSTPTNIYYRYRKASPGDTKYVNLSGTATIESNTGVSVKRSMMIDLNNNS